MDVKQHYDKHLGNFYSWMSGDFKSRVKEFSAFLRERAIRPQATGIAVDLGAGHGIHSVALSQAGFTVQAIDFNEQLLKQLHKNAELNDIHVIKDDLRNFKNYCQKPPELILCWGDTLSHLESRSEIDSLLGSCCEALCNNGLLLLSFRDYTKPLEGDERFIHVKADEKKILTCFLEFLPDRVRVTDVLHENTGGAWKQKISSYHKVRISPPNIKNRLLECGMELICESTTAGMVQLIAKKR